MLTLHYRPSTASLTPHILLNEIGARFELALVDKATSAQRSPAYLALNPHGFIPTLVDGDLVLYETAAIVLHLVDKFPESHLAPAVGTRHRALFYRWIANLSCTVQAEMRAYFYPEQHVADAANAADVKRTAERRVTDLFAILEDQLGAGPYALGATYSAADPYLTMLVRWTRNMESPARLRPNLARHAERVLARPAVQKSLDREGLTAPFI